MPFARVSRLILVTVLSLALLFAVLEPEPSRGMPLPMALGFWTCHIGIGLLLAIAATALLSRAMAEMAPWPRLLAGGVLGSLLFAPVALVLETLLSGAATAEAPDGLLEQWQLQGGALALLAEWLQLAPSYLASWLLINAVPLAAAPSIQGPPAGPGGRIGTATHPPAADPRSPPSSDAHEPVDTGSASIPETANPGAAAEAGFLQQLPPAIGSDLVWIRSDLHYLQVRTVIGRAIVLGSIAAAEASLGAQGLRVHRSFWVALRHVRRVGRSANGAYCILSDGSRIPVSRRRAAAVRDHLGMDFVVDPH